LRRLKTLILPLSLLALTACMSPETTVRRSSLMDYLYPKQAAAPKPQPEEARLQLPLRLGIAFVPGGQEAWRVQGAVSADQEKRLAEVVRGTFKDKPWVADIKVIPSTYLQTRGGFDNLEQVARMYGVEVIALLSVDQIQYTDPRWYSFTYLSILGAFVLPGDANDTRTLIDAAVFDVFSRTFLLRAPGQSQIKGSSTWAAREPILREHSQKGFQLAMGDLAKNLDAEVSAFKAEIARGDRKGVDVLDRQGVSLRQSGGRNFGGGVGLAELGAALGLLWLVRRVRG
jgi:rhombotail lipoprotein